MVVVVVDLFVPNSIQGLFGLVWFELNFSKKKFSVSENWWFIELHTKWKWKSIFFAFLRIIQKTMFFLSVFLCNPTAYIPKHTHTLISQCGLYKNDNYKIFFLLQNYKSWKKIQNTELKHQFWSFISFHFIFFLKMISKLQNRKLSISYHLKVVSWSCLFSFIHSFIINQCYVCVCVSVS